MKSTSRRSRSLMLGLLVLVSLALTIAALSVILRPPYPELPYQDSFAKGKADEWTALGGNWELANGTMRNDSDERGAKIIMGSPYWGNYSIEADVYLLGASGDAGLVVRSSNEEEGVNAYSGYYAGVRTIDNSLVLGRAEHGWMEVTRQSATPEDIRPFHWYHLKLLAYGCQIVAGVTSPANASRILLGIDDPNCLRSGRVGLRSYSSGGSWRNIVVRSATHQDLLEMLKRYGGGGKSVPSVAVEQDPKLLETNHPAEGEKTLIQSQFNTQSIASLRLDSFTKPSNATIRGVVILTAPRLYVQDSTGGVYIPHPGAALLKVGDEVEITGQVHPGDFSSSIEPAKVRVLWASTPTPPVSITASQASTGNYDATFIEVQGRLIRKKYGADNTLILDLDQGTQPFRAILNPGRSNYLFSKLKLNSHLRLRGVCVVDPELSGGLTPFVLLLRSNEDLAVIAGPPWWNAGHVAAMMAIGLFLALAVVSLYHRIANWRIRSILQERERLAHEMHDTLAQSFAGIGFQLQAIRNRLPDELPMLHQQVALASDLVRHSHEEARRSIATLQTHDLESDDILAALVHCAECMVKSGSIQVTPVGESSQRPIPLRIADTLYRIGQEAIANTVRHAEPTVLTIRLSYSENSVCLSVEDNGRGFEQHNGLPGFGIRGMRRRAHVISAVINIYSALGEGTRIEVVAPLPPRITLSSLPRITWKYIVEYWINGEQTKRSNSDPHRG